MNTGKKWVFFLFLAVFLSVSIVSLWAAEEESPALAAPDAEWTPSEDVLAELQRRVSEMRSVSNDYANDQIKIAYLKRDRAKLLKNMNDDALSEEDKEKIREELASIEDQLKSMQDHVTSNRDSFAQQTKGYQDYVQGVVEQEMEKQK